MSLFLNNLQKNICHSTNCLKLVGFVKIRCNLLHSQRILGGKSPATSAHMSLLLRLLPSGPDRVHKISLREDQRLTIEDAHYA